MRWLVLAVAALAWIASLWFVALLQLLGVFGEDDQPWQAVLIGNVLYVIVVTILPIGIGWAVYAALLPSVWRATAAAPTLLSPVLGLSALVVFLPEGGAGWWPLPIGYASLVAVLVHAIGQRGQWNNAGPPLPWR